MRTIGTTAPETVAADIGAGEAGSGALPLQHPVNTARTTAFIIVQT